MNYNKVLLISIDSLGRQYSKPFEKYFNIIYSHYRTINTWTLPSHLTMLSGLYFPDLYEKLVPVYEIDKLKNYAKKIPTIATIFKEKGFKTKAIVGGGFISKYFGWGKDWDEWIEPTNGIKTWNGEEIFPKNNQFIFLHTYYVHNWFDEDSYLRNTFRQNRKKGDVEKKFNTNVIKKGKKAYLKRINKLALKMNWLNKLDKNTLVIFTSDHGELFKEDKINFHHGQYAVKSPKIFDVPLMIKDGRINKKYSEDKSYYDIHLSYLIKNKLNL